MANSKRNLSGKWSDPLTSANITDPGQKERNKNGFPHNDSSAAGIFRKKFLDYLSTVKVEGGADLTQSLREAREGLTEMIIQTLYLEIQVLQSNKQVPHALSRQLIHGEVYLLPVQVARTCTMTLKPIAPKLYVGIINAIIAHPNLVVCCTFGPMILQYMFGYKVLAQLTTCAAASPDTATMYLFSLTCANNCTIDVFAVFVLVSHNADLNLVLGQELDEECDTFVGQTSLRTIYFVQSACILVLSSKPFAPSSETLVRDRLALHTDI